MPDPSRLADPDAESARLRLLIDRSVERLWRDIDRQVEAEVARSSGYGRGLRAGLLVGVVAVIALGCLLALVAP